MTIDYLFKFNQRDTNSIYKYVEDVKRTSYTREHVNSRLRDIRVDQIL